MDPSGPGPTQHPKTSISWAQCQGFCWGFNIWIQKSRSLSTKSESPASTWSFGCFNQESHPRGIHIFLFGFLLICCWGNHISLLVLGHGNLLWMQYIHIYIYTCIYIMNLIYVWIYYITYLNLVCGFNPHHHRIVYDAVKNAILLQAAAPSNYGTWKRQLWKKAINS